MITVKQAQIKLIESLACQQETELVSIDHALGRVAAKDVVSSLMVPQTDNSAMDGFAVNSSDFKNFDREQTMQVTQRIPAGTKPKPLQAGTAARIFTGGVMPIGADAVVIQENCLFKSSDMITIKKSVTAKENVRPAGQDINIGEIVVKKGQRLSAVDLSLVTAIGHNSIYVFKPLTVAIFSTGDELAEPGEMLKLGQIYNSNRTLLTTLCKQLGFKVVDIGIIEDTLEDTKTALLEAAKRADFILSSGGVSVGEEDHVKPAVEALGTLDLWKVQMKPGKPVAYGQIAGTPLLGLPGNPVSSFIVFQLLGVPALLSLQGQTIELPRSFSVESGFEKKCVTREEYIRVQLQIDDTGKRLALPFKNLSSGVLSSLTWADGLVRQNIDQTICIGDSLEYLPLNNGML